MTTRIRFSKMHGLGNDFVVIDGINQPIDLSPEKIRKIANRHTGVGCDQLLIVETPTLPTNDFRYRIFNYDGSEVENCGNGARCFAKFVRDKKLTGKNSIRVETLGGDLVLRVNRQGAIRVDMGVPTLEPADIPFAALQQQVSYELPLSVPMSAPSSALPQTLLISAVSMGNPHAVTIVDNVNTAPVAELGPLVEGHSHFPQRVNAGFMAIRSANTIDLRVYERGVGETQACGTGACAAVVAGRLSGQLASEVTVNLPGGQLFIEWQGEGHSVFMTGPAVTVFQGQLKV